MIDHLHELGLSYSEQQAAAIFVQVAEAVAHLHEYRVLHRWGRPYLCVGGLWQGGLLLLHRWGLVAERCPEHMCWCIIVLDKCFQNAPACTHSPALHPHSHPHFYTLHLRHMCIPPHKCRLPCPAPCRDIKPENVMFAQPPAEAKEAPLTAAGYKMAGVKLVDLGMACLYDPAEPITGGCGRGRGGLMTVIGSSSSSCSSSTALVRADNQPCLRATLAPPMPMCLPASHTSSAFVSPSLVLPLQARWAAPGLWLPRLWREGCTPPPWMSSVWGCSSSSCWWVCRLGG